MYNDGVHAPKTLMTAIEVTSRVDASGVLNLSIPLTAADAHREVRVIVEPLDEIMSSEDWQTA